MWGLDEAGCCDVHKKFRKILERCLASIYKEIPVCHLIIIDGYSTDKTIEILEKFKSNYKNIKIVQTNSKLGKAREIGIRMVDTEWFAFIDSDVILPEKWFEKMMKHTNEAGEKTGAIESNHVHHYPDNTPKFPEFKGVVNQTLDGKRTDTRALTIGTIVKTTTVRDISIPEDLEIYEDEYIRRYVEERGYLWIKLPEPILDHYPNPKPWKDAYLSGRYSIKYHFLSPRRIIFVSIFFPIKLLYFWIRCGSLRASLNSVLYSWYMLKGVIDESLVKLKKIKDCL